jgi:type I restriction enzyme S subunit
MVPYLRAANVKNGQLDLTDVKTMDFNPSEQRTFSLLPGDVLVSEGSGSLGTVGASAVWNAEIDGVVCFQNTLLRLRPKPGNDPRFLMWWARHAYGSGLFASIADGANIYHLGADGVRTLPAAMPDARTQRAIADYLDAETARMDQLMEACRRKRELLQERQSALVLGAVAGSVHDDPSSGSGTGWPPARLPAGWRLVPIRYAAHVGRGASPRPIDDPIFFDDQGEYAWVRISDVTSSSRYLWNTEQRLSALGASKSVKLEPGSLIVSIAASVGHAIITAIPCCVHDGFVYFQSLQGVTPEYLFHVLSSGSLFEGLGKLGTQLNLNTDTIGDIRIPLPPPGEQAEIVERLDHQIAAYAALRSAVDRQIDILVERRQALITAAVTGQIEIPGVAA